MSILTLKKIARFFIYISLITPLLAFPSHFVFPFIVPKVVFFRSLMILVGVTVFLTWFCERKTIDRTLQKSRFWTPLTVVLLVYLLSLIISTIVGVDWRFSLWNNHERMLGLFTILHYFILFYSCRYLFINWLAWRKLFIVFSVVGVVVVAVAVIQKFYPNFFYNKGAGEVISTLGNPIYLAGYGLFLCFVGLFSALQEKGSWWRWYFLSVAGSGLIAIFSANTKGTFLGLICGIGLVAFIYLGLSWNKMQKKNKFAVVIPVFILLVLTISVFVFRKTVFIQSVPVVSKIVNVDFFAGSAQTRFMAWGVAWQGFKDKPVFGWGPNNYYYVFNKFYNPDFLKFGFQETWFDNAHNVFFNAIAEQGVAGLLIYLMIFVVSGYYLKIIYQSNHNRVLLLLCGGFLVGHLVHNFFVFENVTSFLYFFLFLAFLDSVFRNKQDFFSLEVSVRVDYKQVSPSILIFALIFSVVAILATNINVAMANNQDYKAQGFTKISRQYQTGFNNFQKTFFWHSPYQDDIGWDYSSSVLDVLPNIYSASTTTARQFYDISLPSMEKYINHHPQDVRGRLFFIDLLRAGIVLFDLPLQDKVDEQFKIAHELSPGRQQVEYAELTFLAGTGKMAEAIAGAKKMVVDYPYSDEGYYNLARFYFFDNQMLEILPVLDQAIRNGVYFTDPEHITFVAQAYEREGRFRDALYWWDQLYKSTGQENIKNKRDELSRITKKPIPQSLEEFFKFDIVKTNKTSGTEAVLEIKL